MMVLMWGSYEQNVRAFTYNQSNGKFSAIISVDISKIVWINHEVSQYLSRTVSVDKQATQRA